MELRFQVHARIARPTAEVFEAIADPDKLSGYFTTGGARGRLEAGTTVTWDFADFPGAFPVDVVDVIPNERIVLRWAGTNAEDGRTTVTITFEPLDGDTRTLVSIAEEGWRQTPAALADSYGNCMGWSQMLAALKVYVEHGINLREGMYK
jgi:uncharacterized protein YndB with AHSA1/START domain